MHAGGSFCWYGIPALLPPRNNLEQTKRHYYIPSVRISKTEKHSKFVNMFILYTSPWLQKKITQRSIVHNYQVIVSGFNKLVIIFQGKERQWSSS
jgi:hypothetical protein